LQFSSTIQNDIIFPKYKIEDQEEEVLVLWEDSLVLLTRIGLSEDKLDSIVLNPTDPSTPYRIKYWKDESLVRLTYPELESDSIDGFYNPFDMSSRYDYYFVNKANQSKPIFSLLGEERSFDTDLALKNSRYKILKNRWYFGNSDKPKEKMFFVDLKGNVDTVSFDFDLSPLKQFGDCVYACANDTILKIHLDSLSIVKIPRKGLNVACKIYAVSSTSYPLIMYYEENEPNCSSFEFVNSSNRIDSIYGSFRLNHNSSENSMIYSSDDFFFFILFLLLGIKYVLVS
jgi:hypothetical protein